MLLFCKFFGKNKSKKDQFTLISLPVLLISSENLLVYLPEAFILSISTKLEKASWTRFFCIIWHTYDKWSSTCCGLKAGWLWKSVLGLCSFVGLLKGTKHFGTCKRTRHKFLKNNYSGSMF